jgi:hypothetical protein
MSAPSPWDRSPLDEPEVDPSGRRRRAATAAVVAGAVVLAIVVYLAAGGSGGDNTALWPFRAGTTPTTTPAAHTTTSTSTATSPASPTTVAPIHVDLVVGMVVIAGRVACTHEGELTGDSLADVEAAVAADNNGTGSATVKPYAHDAAAQSEIVRASVQQLHSTHRFYADCRPVPATARSGSSSASGTPSSSTASLPPSR